MVHERSQELLARGFPVPGYEVLTERRKSEIAGKPMLVNILLSASLNRV